MVTSERMKELWKDQEFRKKMSKRNSPKGKKVSSETRKKISESRKGIKFSEEHKKKLSESHIGKESKMKGIKFTENRRKSYQNYWDSMKGKVKGQRSEETKLKISKKNSGKGNGRWNGGIKESGGYIKIHSPNHPLKDKSGYVMAHRIRVENFIGRFLTRQERIHHIDFNRKNNKISNLFLFPSGSEHLKFHIYFEKYGFNQTVRRKIEKRWKLYKE